MSSHREHTHTHFLFTSRICPVLNIDWVVFSLKKSKPTSDDCVMMLLVVFIFFPWETLRTVVMEPEWRSRSNIFCKMQSMQTANEGLLNNPEGTIKTENLYLKQQWLDKKLLKLLLCEIKTDSGFKEKHPLGIGLKRCRI